jgi:hypothetical protein
VRFNAWQYSAADVWAGLLEQLVRQLATSGGIGLEDSAMPQELSDLEKNRIQRLSTSFAEAAAAAEKLEKAQDAHRDAATAVETAQRNLDSARQTAHRIRADAVVASGQEGAWSALDQTLRSLGQPGAGADLREAWSRISDARRQAESLSAFAVARPRLLVVTIVAPYVAGLIAGLGWFWLNLDQPGFAAVATGLLTLVTGWAGYFRTWSAEAARQLAPIQKAEQDAAQIEQAATAAAAAAQRKLDKAAEEVESQRQRLVDREGELVQARQVVARTTTGDLV